jgi:hypothetical protein
MYHRNEGKQASEAGTYTEYAYHTGRSMTKPYKLSNPSLFLPFPFLYPSSCRCGLCTGRVGTLYRGRDGSSVRVRSREGGRSCCCSSTARRQAGIRHLLNQRTIKCLEATEEYGRMSFELQTLCVAFLRSSKRQDNRHCQGRHALPRRR